MGGGDFLQGAAFGGIVAGANHLGHRARFRKKMRKLGIPKNPRTLAEIMSGGMDSYLGKFRKKYFSEMEKQTLGTVWEVDYVLEHTGRNDGRTAPDGSQVWVHPKAFKNDWKLYHVVGHEYAHLKHIHLGDFSRWLKSYNKDISAVRAISEYRAYKWNVENQDVVPYSPRHFNKSFLFWKGKLPKGYRK